MLKRFHFPKDNGFTLIEIVISLAILAIALPVLIRAFTHSAKGQGSSENETTAIYLLRYKMAEIEMNGYPEVAEDEGEFGENSRFRWGTKVQETETEGLRLVTVTVTWQEMGKEKSISMNTYMADKTLSQPQQSGGQQAQSGSQSGGAQAP